MRVRKVDIPIYYGKLIIVISNNYPKVAKRYKIEEDISKAGAFVWNDEKNDQLRYYVCVDENIENHLIAHEVVHLVNLIFLDRHIELDRQNDEPQAYLTAWIFKQIEDFLIDKK